MEKLYIALFLFILVMAGINLLVKTLKRDIRDLEQNRHLKIAKIFYTPHGKLFVKNHVEGIECTNEQGKKVIISGYKVDTLEDSIALSIVITSFI